MGTAYISHLLAEEFVPNFAALLEVTVHLPKKPDQGSAILLHALGRKREEGTAWFGYSMISWGSSPSSNGPHSCQFGHLAVMNGFTPQHPNEVSQPHFISGELIHRTWRSNFS